MRHVPSQTFIVKNQINHLCIMELSATVTTTCANCGKGEENTVSLKACVACKIVKYCNRDCQIAHRPQHKRECKKRAKVLYDEALFADPPPPKECPICFLPIPVDLTQTTFSTCCGKKICCGCLYGMILEQKRKGKKGEEIGTCPFCRTPKASSDEETIERYTKLMEKGNAEACNQLGAHYAGGELGLPQDWTKAMELWRKAGELGCAGGNSHLGELYDKGMGVVVDKKKANHYYELAAMGGDVCARHNLGCKEYNAGNYQRAYKHYMIAAQSGYNVSLDEVKEGFMRGFVAKDEYEQTLRIYQKRVDAETSDTRSEALLAMQEATL